MPTHAPIPLAAAWLATALLATALLVVGCSKGSKAPAPESGAAAADEAAPKVDEAAPKVDEAAPKADEAAPKADEVAPIAPAEELTMDELKELERRPGATPALKQVELPAPAKHPSLSGTPGPLPAAGPDDALVKVFVFSDFQCPVCRRAAEPTKLLARQFPADVQVVFVHNALAMHSRAEAAARAAIAAQMQGKFWEYYDTMFEHARRLEDADLEHYARLVGLDLDRFLADIASPAIAERVVYERSLAEAIGSRGTPGFLINGSKTVGWGSYVGLRSQVQRAVNQAKRMVDAGTPRPEVAKLATQGAGEDGAKFAELLWGMKGQ